MKCPVCGVWSETTYTSTPDRGGDNRPVRYRGQNVTWRRRKCANGHNFTSVEMVESALQVQATLWSSLDQLYDTLAELRVIRDVAHQSLSVGGGDQDVPEETGDADEGAVVQSGVGGAQECTG